MSHTYFLFTIYDATFTPHSGIIIGASLSEPHIDGTAGRFHILSLLLLLLWYDCHPRAAVGRTKYVGLPCKLCEQQLADGGRTTTLYRPLASLVNNKAQLQNCLDIYKPKGCCTSIVSVVLLVIDIEKKTCPISRFYDRSD